MNISRHLKLEIASAIPVANEWKIETNNSAGFNNRNIFFNSTHYNNFHSLEFVDRVSETQFQVGKNSNLVPCSIIWISIHRLWLWPNIYTTLVQNFMFAG